MPQSSESNKSLILEWLGRLSKHFGTELDEGQIEIFLHALQKCSPYQVTTAFEACLNECEFMPRLAQIHERMPEQRNPPGTGEFVTHAPPLLDVVRPIAEEICKEFTGMEFNDLDAFKYPKLRHDLFGAANRLRYERMGIDTSKWGPPEFLDPKIIARESRR